MYEVDLNCDMGEHPGDQISDQDEEMMQYISSVNIACGFHAGSTAMMQQTVAAAIKNNLAIGAHPGFQDREGFGRRNISTTPAEVYQITLYQIGALSGFVKAAGGTLHHVKPHGALYNMAAENESLSQAIALAVSDFDRSLILYGLSGSELIKAGIQKGLRTANEVFADRSYQSTGFLTPRSQEAAMITNPADALAQVISMIKNKYVLSLDKIMVNVKADTICIHGDNEHAIAFAKTLNDGLKKAGIRLKKL